MTILLIALVVVLFAASFYADFRWKKWMAEQEARRHDEESPR
jgi:hypothetical protein